MEAAYQSPWGWNRRSCVANQAGPGHRRRILGSGGVGAVPSSYLCFLGVDLYLSWLVVVVEEASGRVTCFFGVDLGLSWVEEVATRKVTCESYGWSCWGLVVRRSGRGMSRPEGVDAVHRSWNSAAEPFYKLAKVP